MTIPSEQHKILNGALHTIALNPDYTIVQVTLTGRNTGTVTATIRPILELNSPGDFIADDFEGVEDGVIDLAANPKKRTITIEGKRCSALRLADSGAGNFKVSIRQWGRVNH